MHRFITAANPTRQRNHNVGPRTRLAASDRHLPRMRDVYALDRGRCEGFTRGSHRGLRSARRAQSHYFAGGLSTVPPRLELLPFRYRDAVSGKWVRARYLAERHIIEQLRRVGAHRAAGDPRRRSARRLFQPVGESAARQDASERTDDLERFLVLLLLRRYVTYCARRAAFAEMNGAAQLHRKLGAAM